MDEKFFTLVDFANNCIINNESIPDNLLEEIKQVKIDNKLIGVAQIDSHSGNLEYNAKKITRYIKYANKISLDAIMFPEFSLTGALLGDSITKFPVIVKEASKWLQAIANLTKDTTVFIGTIEEDGSKLYDSIAVLKNGVIERFIRKVCLSNGNYGKYVSVSDNIENLSYNNYGVIIGDDLEKLSLENLESIFKNNNYIINFCSLGVSEQLRMQKNSYISYLSNKYNKTVPLINSVGVTDFESFCGISSVFDNGHLFARSKSFEEQIMLVDLQNKSGKIYQISPKDINNTGNLDIEFSLNYEYDLPRTYKVLVNGIKSYFNKCGLHRAVLGLSGGLDSTICAVLLADAIGKENVFGVSMPSHITTKESKSDAEMLARNLGIHFIEKSIKPMISTTSDCLEDIFVDVSKEWGKYWDCNLKDFSNDYRGEKPVSFTMDNIQARSRAIYLWGIANEFSSCIPIATSDKSELYMGYATINGDMSGGFAPIADVPKTKLFALARWMNKNRSSKFDIPESIILKRPGAELAINPKTGKPLIAEDALMPYEFLDEIIWRTENKNQTYKDLMGVTFIYEKNNNVSKSQKEEWLDKFYRRMSFALFKWTLLPPSIKVEDYSILKNDYYQPVTSSKINYKGIEQDVMDKILRNL